MIIKRKFEDQVASKEPQRITRNYKIPLKRLEGYCKELNRFIMVNDFKNGKPMPHKLQVMQHEILPSVDTPNIKISYEIEVIINHEGILGSSKDI